jgi:hypothetical protein
VFLHTSAACFAQSRNTTAPVTAVSHTDTVGMHVSATAISHRDVGMYNVLSYTCIILYMYYPTYVWIILHIIILYTYIVYTCIIVHVCPHTTYFLEYEAMA